MKIVLPNGRNVFPKKAEDETNTREVDIHLDCEHENKLVKFESAAAKKKKTLTKIQKRELTDLRNILRRATVAYTKGEPMMSDEEFDAYEDQLRDLSPNDKLLSKIGSAPSKKMKVRLPYSMGSLPKVRMDRNLKTIISFLKGKRVEASDKLDGVSAMYFDDKGKKYLYTRGDGSMGGDITHLIGTIKGLGKLKRGEAVRGELGMSKTRFNKTYASDFKNGRNMVSGIVNSVGRIHPAAKDIVFVVHESVMPRRSLSASKERLKTNGFHVVPYRTFVNPTADRIAEHLRERMTKSKLDIDGLVLDDGSNERLAFKSINEIKAVTVDRVEWNVSRHGKYKPRVWFKKPVQLAGVTVHKATAHNAKYVKDNKIGPGAKMLVTRSGEVIPYIVSVTHGTKAQFPPKGTFLWKTDTDISAVGDGASPTIIGKNLVHFLVTIGVDKVKLSSASKLVAVGIDSIPKLVKAKRELLLKSGIGDSLTRHMLSAIPKALGQTEEAEMMYASSAFHSGLGKRRFDPIIEHLGYTAIVNENVKPKTWMSTLKTIPGVGESVAKDFIQGVPAFRKFVKAIKWSPADRAFVAKTKFTGKVFVQSGYRDKGDIDLIKGVGGKMGSGVTKKTNYLVTTLPNSLKAKKAKQLKVTILSPAQLHKLLNSKKNRKR